MTEQFSNTIRTLKIYQSPKNYKIEEVVHFECLPLTFYMALLILHVGIIHLTEDEDKLTPWWFFLSYVKTLVQSVALLKKTKAQWLLGEICLFKKYLETLAYGYDLSGVNKVLRFNHILSLLASQNIPITKSTNLHPHFCIFFGNSKADH